MRSPAGKMTPDFDACRTLPSVTRSHRVAVEASFPVSERGFRNSKAVV